MQEGHPKLHSHEYVRKGGAKLMILFRPATGEVRAKGVPSVTNAVLHPWLQKQLLELLAILDQQQTEAQKPLSSLPRSPIDGSAQWETWLGWKLSDRFPPLRMILVWDDLAGHRSDPMVTWLFEHGIMPLYTPLGGSWLNMAESMQRILVR